MGDLRPEMLLQVALAVGCGGAIGIEREVRGRAAGLRTMILVCLGATLTMIVSNELARPTGEVETAILRVDPGRIAAGIVTGIGFLGGAVVVKLGDLVRGVTTAASIWLAAALGIVIGERFYMLAIVGVVVALTVLAVFSRLERLLPNPVYRAAMLRVGSAGAANAERAARALFEQRQARIMDLEAESDADLGSTRLTFQVRVDHAVDARELVEALGSIEGVRQSSWGPI